MSDHQRSSLNSLRNGLSGQVVVLPQEELEAYNKFSRSIVATFHPFDAHETQLAQSYAGMQWRLNRIAAIEDTMLTLGVMEDIAGNLNVDHAEAHNAISYAKAFRNDAMAFDRLSLYNQRLLNGAAKVLKQLQDLQAKRRERQQSEPTLTVSTAPSRGADTRVCQVETHLDSCAFAPTP